MPDISMEPGRFTRAVRLLAGNCVYQIASIFVTVYRLELKNPEMSRYTRK